MTKSLIVTADIQNWNKIYEFITKYFEKSGLSKKNIFGIVISSEEIFSNILHHSHAAVHDDISISADYQALAKTASIVFKYGGMEFNPLETHLPDVNVPPHKRKLGGLGLLIIKNFTDNIKYTYTGDKNILEISKKIIEL